MSEGILQKGLILSLRKTYSYVETWVNMIEPTVDSMNEFLEYIASFNESDENSIPTY